jgi:hypothetical protein
MTRPILIGLHGRARAGKDTVGSLLVRMGLDRVAFADPLKHMLMAMGLDDYHFEGEAKERPIFWLGKSPRQLLQTLGTEWGRELVHPEIWVRIAGGEIAASHLAGRGVVVTDVRMQDEADYIRRCGGEIWHIIREVQPVAQHASEAGISPQSITRTIDNTGTLEHLERQVTDAAWKAVRDRDPCDAVEEGA